MLGFPTQQRRTTLDKVDEQPPGILPLLLSSIIAQTNSFGRTKPRSNKYVFQAHQDVQVLTRSNHPQVTSSIPNIVPSVPLPPNYQWPRGITVGHVLLDSPLPSRLPAYDPGLVFPHPFPPIPSTSITPMSYPVVHSRDGSLWHPGLNCGWFPVTLVYQGLVPLSGRAWVHLWPTSEEPPAEFVPPSFSDKSAIDFNTTPELYFGRFYIHKPHDLP